MDLRVALIASEWEKAKGQLRACVAIQGSYPSGKAEAGGARWELFRDDVEAFIKMVEHNAYHE